MNRSLAIQTLLVGLGGFLGASLRFLASGFVYRLLPAATFPHGTLAVNVSGCLAIGLLSGMGQAGGMLGPAGRLFLLIGVLGGFTTFSTFAYETLALAQGGEASRALANTLLHLALGFGAAWLGYVLSRVI